jgi:hypothetical protein
MTAMNETYVPYPETTGTVDELLRLIKAEYLEIPGLCLTPPQVKRFWNLDAVTAESVMATLVDVQYHAADPARRVRACRSGLEFGIHRGNRCDVFRYAVPIGITFITAASGTVRCWIRFFEIPRR